MTPNNRRQIVRSTYWSGKGLHQATYDRLYAELVPCEGPAWTRHGELLRCFSKLYHDHHNNGAGNFNLLSKHIDVLMGWRSDLSYGGGWKLINFIDKEITGDNLESLTDEIILLVERVNSEQASN